MFAVTIGLYTSHKSTIALLVFTLSFVDHSEDLLKERGIKYTEEMGYSMLAKGLIIAYFVLGLISATFQATYL